MRNQEQSGRFAGGKDDAGWKRTAYFPGVFLPHACLPNGWSFVSKCADQLKKLEMGAARAVDACDECDDGDVRFMDRCCAAKVAAVRSTLDKSVEVGSMLSKVGSNADSA